MSLRFVLFVGALAAGPSAFAQATTSKARPEALLPQGTLYYVGCDDFDAMLAKWSASPSGQVIKEKEVQEFLQKPLQALRAGIERGLTAAKQHPALAQLDLSLDKILAGPYGSCFLALTQLEMPPAGAKFTPQAMDIGLVVGVEAKPGAIDVVSLVKQVLASVLESESGGESKLETVESDGVAFERISPPGEAPSLVFANVAGINVMSLSSRTIVGMLKRAKGEGKSLLADPDYGRCVAALGAPVKGDLVGYMQIGRFTTALADALLAGLASSGQQQGHDIVQKIFDVTKLGSMGPSFFISSWRDGVALNTSYGEVDSAAGGLCSLARSVPIDMNLLRLVPKDSTGFRLSSFDLAPIYDTVMDAVKSVQPDIHQMITQKLHEFETMVAGADENGAPNWDLRRDLIGAIGGRMMVVDYPSTGSSMMMGMTPEMAMWIESPHPDSLEKSLGNLFNLVGQLGGQQIKFKEQVYDDVKLEVLDNMSLGMVGAMTGGMQITYSIHDGRFYFATTTKALKKMLDAEKKPPEHGIAERKDFSDRFVEPPKGAVVTSLSYADTAADFEKGYNALVSMIPMLTMALPIKLDTLPLDISLLPTGETISQHLFGTVSISYSAGKNAHVTESRGPFGAELGLGIGVGAAAAAAIGASYAEKQKPQWSDGESGAAASGHKAAAKATPERAARDQVDDFNRAITIYMIEYGKPPASLDELTQPRPSYPKGFLDGKPLPNDPWGHAYHYSTDGKDKYMIWSSGPDGIDQNGAPGSDDVVKKSG